MHNFPKPGLNSAWTLIYFVGQLEESRFEPFLVLAGQTFEKQTRNISASDTLSDINRTKSRAPHNPGKPVIHSTPLSLIGNSTSYLYYV